MAPPPVLLASTSRYRRALLERLGIPFTWQPPLCDEEALKDPLLGAQDLASHLALAKASSLIATHPHCAIIGSDQVLVHEGRLLGKPGSIERACAQLQALSGASHELVTAVAICHAGRVWRHTAIARLRMRVLDDAQIRRYVQRDVPLDCAGAYKLEAGGISLFSEITTDDHSAITGLPLLAVVRILGELGWAIP